jgi:C4-dicarboxylate-specific signal transduction histidine kinase
MARQPSGRASRIVGTMSVATHRLREEAERRHLEQAFFQNIRLSTVAEVASGLSHEINQPLTTAMMQVQAAQRLLERRVPAKAEAVRALDTAVSAIERAAAIARRHRQPVKRPGTGWKRFDLVATSRHVVDLLRPDARAAAVTIDVRCPRRSLLVEGDRVQVEQVVANLVRNAIEAVALAADRRRVQVSVTRAGRLAQVRVADSGPGVAAQVRPSLFLPYVTTKPDGTGLGLALSRTIAESHGGRLLLEQSTPDGAVFLFEWPVSRVPGPRTRGQARE